MINRVSYISFLRSRQHLLKEDFYLSIDYDFTA